MTVVMQGRQGQRNNARGPGLADVEINVVAFLLAAEWIWWFSTRFLSL